MVTATWAIVLLDRSPNWNPWLRPLIGGAATLAVAGLVVSSTGLSRGRSQRWAARLALGAGTLACMAGPLAFTLQTVGTAHTGSLPSAGSPSGAGGRLAGAGGGVPTNTGNGFPGPGQTGKLSGSRPGRPGLGGTGVGGTASA